MLIVDCRLTRQPQTSSVSVSVSRALLRWEQVGRQGGTHTSIRTIEEFRPKNDNFCCARGAKAIGGNQQNARATGDERPFCSFKGTALNLQGRLIAGKNVGRREEEDREI
jgi:hypothetical protein